LYNKEKKKVGRGGDKWGRRVGVGLVLGIFRLWWY
jgi:hypothetical protein